MPNGGPIETGSTLMRVSSSSRCAFAARSPRVRNSAVSWPPMATTGTIGTPRSSASLMNPWRPPNSIWSECQLGRKVS